MDTVHCLALSSAVKPLLAPDPHKRHDHLVEHLHQHPVLCSLHRVLRVKLDSWEDIHDVLAGHQGFADSVAVMDHNRDLAEGVELPKPFRLNVKIIALFTRSKALLGHS